jgi:hypothetical protein
MEKNTAELLQQMIDIKRDIQTSLNTKGVTVVSGMKVYADAINRIEQNVSVEGIGIDYTQIGWTEQNNITQNTVDAIVVNEEIMKSKQVWDVYKDKEWVFDDTMIGASDYNMFLTKIKDLTYLPVFNLSKVLTTNNLFRDNTKIKVCSSLNTTLATDMSNMFDGAILLESVGDIDCSSAKNVDNMFTDCHSLMHIGGLTNLGKNMMEGTSVKGMTLHLSGAPRLTRESILNVFNTIFDVSTLTGISRQIFYIYLSSNQKALLSLDDLAIANNKGWSVSVDN